MINKSKIYEYLTASVGMEFSEIEELLILGEMKIIKKKELLAQPGMKINHSYFLVDGIVRHYVLGPDGKEFTKHLLKSPAFFVSSVPNFFLRTEDSIHCEALSDLVVMEWTYDQIMNFASKQSKFFHFLLKCVVDMYKQKEEKEISGHFLDARARYKKFLIDYPDLAYEVPLRYIASYLNIRPETLSRIRASK